MSLLFQQKTFKMASLMLFVAPILQEDITTRDTCSRHRATRTGHEAFCFTTIGKEKRVKGTPSRVVTDYTAPLMGNTGFSMSNERPTAPY